MSARFVIYEKSGWRWRLVAGNGETVATSEPYASSSKARQGAENVKNVAATAGIINESTDD